MRQDHQRQQSGHNYRNRNRSKNRNQNLAQRTLDSNGPDIKIRGTAAHLCKKYQSLARDAQLAGNRIRAESYLQHADHYYRIVMVAQAQQQNQQPPPSASASAPAQEMTQQAESQLPPEPSAAQNPPNMDAPPPSSPEDY